MFNNQKEEIISVKKDAIGRLVEFKTNKNKIYDYETAIEAIEDGIITNATVVKTRFNKNVIKGINNINLGDLPEFF